MNERKRGNIIRDVTKDLWAEDKVKVSNQKLLPPSKSTQTYAPTKRTSVKKTAWDSIKTNNSKEDVRKLQDLLNDLPNKVNETIRNNLKESASKSTTQIKNPITSEPTQKTVTSKVNRKLGRKVLTGLGVTALGMGALYGLNKLRKTR